MSEIDVTGKARGLRKSLFSEPQVTKRLVKNTFYDEVDLSGDDYLDEGDQQQQQQQQRFPNRNHRPPPPPSYLSSGSNFVVLEDDDDDDDVVEGDENDCDQPIITNQYRLSGGKSTALQKGKVGTTTTSHQFQGAGTKLGGGGAVGGTGGNSKPYLMSSMRKQGLPPPSTGLNNYNLMANGDDDELSNAFRLMRNRSVLGEKKHFDDIGDYKRLLQAVMPRLYGRTPPNDRFSGGGEEFPTEDCGTLHQQEQASCLNIYNTARTPKMMKQQQQPALDSGKMPTESIKRSSSEAAPKVVHYVSDRIPKTLPKIKIPNQILSNSEYNLASKAVKNILLSKDNLDEEVVFNGYFDMERCTRGEDDPERRHQLHLQLQELRRQQRQRRMENPPSNNKRSPDEKPHFGWSHYRLPSRRNFPYVVNLDDDDDDDIKRATCTRKAIRKLVEPELVDSDMPSIELCQMTDSDFAMPRIPIR